ncbi:MAG: TrmH family RNA methyltransferase [bacterium]|nr:TrmH family RNA methyltransferase [bacterium]
MRKYTTDELVAQKPTPKAFSMVKRNPIIFILHNIRSLQNVGLFFRLADALLIEKIYLTGYTGYPRLKDDDRPERVILHAENEINKTAIKLVPFVPWERSETIPNLPGYELVGVEQTDESVDYRTPCLPAGRPTALIFGHERIGVEDDVLEKCDKIIHIPMLGMGNSHNVAMSAAIISYHLLSKIKNGNLKP